MFLLLSHQEFFDKLNNYQLYKQDHTTVDSAPVSNWLVLISDLFNEAVVIHESLNWNQEYVRFEGRFHIHWQSKFFLQSFRKFLLKQPSKQDVKPSTALSVQCTTQWPYAWKEEHTLHTSRLYNTLKFYYCFSFCVMTRKFIVITQHFIWNKQFIPNRIVHYWTQLSRKDYEIHLNSH